MRQVWTQVVLLCIVSTAAVPNRVVRAQAGRAAALAGPVIELKGLSKPVSVNYDQRGVPYIDAQNDDDLYFAQGYAVARDRLWQMDLFRRSSRGELAEVFGETALEEDKIHRKYGFAELAGQMIPKLEPKARAAVEAYTRGVNAYIESLDDQSLPVEFRILRYKPTLWQPSDCVIIGKLFAEFLSNSWNLDLVRAAFEGVPEEKRNQIFQTKSAMDVLLIGSDQTTPSGKNQSHSWSAEACPSSSMVEELLALLPSERSWLESIGFSVTDPAASNNWVVSGDHSVTGKPLLANDPHLTPSAPSIWYMISLSEPGFHCEGVTVPGAPGIFIGHNDRVAWGITNVVADVQDLFLEKFDDSKLEQYLTPDGWRPAEIRHEEIKVRKVQTDPATRTLGFDVTVTRHGPIVLEKSGLRYALAWPALDPSTKELEAFYDIDRSQSCKALEKAVGHYSGFPLNFVYADVAGHIGWWAQGRYPIRKNGHGTVPQQGWTGSGDWTGYLPATETPHVYDPPSGIIVTANNRTVGDSYPYYLGELWAEPYRARRIYDLLTAQKKLSADDFQRIQGDTYAMPGAIFAAEVVKMAERLEPASPDWAALHAEFKSWDGRAMADSRAMLIVALMRRAFASTIIQSAFGPDLAQQYSWTSYLFFDGVIQRQPAQWLPKEYKSYSEFILACYRQALEEIKKRLGQDESKWKWGEFVKVQFPHPLSQAPVIGAQFTIPAFPQNGSASTINNGSNVSMRFIADLSAWDNSRLGIPLGESGDPRSPHWKDQLDDWQSVTPALFPFNQKTVDTFSKQKLVLKPAM
jgi:penicillin amidase